jgi:hypothetical protein
MIDRVEHHRVDDERDAGHHAEEAVVGDHEAEDQDEADDPGDQPLAQRLGAQRGPDLLLADRLELDRDGARVQLLGEPLRLALAEVALDLGALVAADADRVVVVVDGGVGDDLAVEDDREALQLLAERAAPGEVRRDVLELVPPLPRELHRHHGLGLADAGGLDHAPGLGDVAAGQLRVVLEEEPGALAARPLAGLELGLLERDE